MDTDAIWTKFSKAIGNIIVFQRKVKFEYNTTIENLFKLDEELRQHDNKNFLSAGHNMSFVDPRTNEHIFYDFRYITVDEDKTQSLLKKNREYQFLIMDAYEQFEDAIEEIYAYLGMNDINFWPLQEFGDIKCNEITFKDFNYFKERAAKRKGGAISIAKKLITYFSCNENIYGIDLETGIIFIEKMRHVIVHNRGKVTSIKDFIEKIVKETGKPINKIPKATSEFIKWYISSEKYDQIIVLDEHKVKKDSFPFPMERSRFDDLINILLVCIYILREKASDYIAKLKGDLR